jgi:hypothetical protein
MPMPHHLMAIHSIHKPGRQIGIGFTTLHNYPTKGLSIIMVYYWVFRTADVWFFVSRDV